MRFRKPGSHSETSHFVLRRQRYYTCTEPESVEGGSYTGTRASNAKSHDRAKASASIAGRIDQSHFSRIDFDGSCQSCEDRQHF